MAVQRGMEIDKRNEMSARFSERSEKACVFLLIPEKCVAWFMLKFCMFADLKK